MVGSDVVIHEYMSTRLGLWIGLWNVLGFDLVDSRLMMRWYMSTEQGLLNAPGVGHINRCW